MKSKIEKIKPRGATWYADDKALLLELNRIGVELENKINEIIEYLNSQDQEEITAVQLWESNRRRMEKILNKEMEERGFMRKNEDTPEEWENEWHSTPQYNQTSFIKDLLKERERELLEEINKTLGTNLKMVDGEVKVVFRKSDKLNK